jgi:hypothetical protein
MLSWKREHFKDKIKASNSMMSVETDNVNASMALGLSMIDAANLGQKLLEHVESLAECNFFFLFLKLTLTVAT